MQSLRPYQTEALQRARRSLMTHRRSILVAPTGAGKTTIAAEIVRLSQAIGRRSLILAHRKELTDQLAARFEQFGVQAGRIQAGKRSAVRQTTVASQPTLVRRMANLPHADLIIVDEAHHAVSNGYKKLLDYYERNGAYILGLTATPARLDGKPLGDIFSDIVDVIPMQSLIDQGYLVQPRYYVAKDALIKTTGVRTVAGDYNSGQLFKANDNVKLYAGVVRNYHRFAAGRRTIVFCINIDHAVQTAQAFMAEGYNAAVLHSNLSTNDREAILKSFSKGDIQILCNVNILTEGYDLPAIECVILNRKTKSIPLYMQMVGRGLRPSPGKTDLIVIDHGRNVLDLDPVESARPWTLEGKVKKDDGVAPIKECPACGSLVAASARFCECGHEFEQQAKQEAESEFVELPRAEKAKWENRPADLRKPVHKMNKTELQAYAKYMGYKPGWVWHRFKLNKQHPGNQPPKIIFGAK